ncbi:DUF2752 domain-containing protein [Streptomyces sp. NPDC096319]|uniref:DUF2752 domain-containing protein n=1 Tax=Streptomyces sp. NPDC096319 TaxID=3366084 RepID=UPI003829B937
MTDSPTQPGEPAHPNATPPDRGGATEGAAGTPPAAQGAPPGAPDGLSGVVDAQGAAVPPSWPDGPGPRAHTDAPGATAPAGHASWSGPYTPPPPPARPLARRLFVPVATLAGVAAAFAYVGTVDPNEPGHYPVCPLLRFTGLYCPGCGGLRSAHAFVHGDLPAALGANALAVVGYGIFAVVIVVWLVRAARDVPMRLAVSPVLWWGVGAVLALFTLVRNLPFGSALAP